MADNPLKKTVEESLAKPVGEIISNVSSPLSKNVGTTMGNIWYLIFGKIDYLADRRRTQYTHNLKKFEEELDKQLGSIPEEKRIIPNTQVAMKALSEAQFCIEEPVLREMFSNLIAKAANADYEDLAHPSFPSIISRLSPYDALLFKEIAERHTLPAAEIWLDKENQLTERLSLLLIAINGQVKSPSDTVRSSLDILISLGLITVDLSKYLYDQSLYTPFEDIELYHLFINGIKETDSLRLQKGVVKVTELGMRFASTCIMR